MKNIIYSSNNNSAYEITPDGKISERNSIDYPGSYDTFILYGKPNVKTERYAYTDRLLQWDYEKNNSCCMKVFGDKGQFWNLRSFKDIEKFLVLYLEEDIELVRVLQTCNHSNGYPIWIFEFNGEGYKSHVVESVKSYIRESLYSKPFYEAKIQKVGFVGVEQIPVYIDMDGVIRFANGQRLIFTEIQNLYKQLEDRRN